MTRPTPADPALAFVDAAIHVTPGRVEHGALWTAGDRLRYVGAADAAPRPDLATRLVDARGASIVPLQVESSVRARPADQRASYELRAGNPATFAVVHGSVGEDRIRHQLVVSPRDLLAVVVTGRLEVWRGEPTRPHEPGAAGPAWVGAWADPSRDMVQHLLPTGRYTETRSGRVDAWTGSWWVRGDRITYLDDTGFWAFGELVSGVLHHAGFVMRRSAPRPL